MKKAYLLMEVYVDGSERIEVVGITTSNVFAKFWQIGLENRRDKRRKRLFEEYDWLGFGELEYENHVEDTPDMVKRFSNLTEKKSF